MTRSTTKPRRPAPKLKAGTNQPKRPGYPAAPFPEPVSLGHQKLHTLGLTAAELSRAAAVNESTVRGWLRQNQIPQRPVQDRLRGLYGIQWGDWFRRPVLPEDAAAEGFSLPTIPDASPVPPVDPAELSTDDVAGLEGLLQRVRAALATASGSAQAQLFTNERAIRVKLSELRAKALTERDRVRACPLLQTYYRLAVEVLRPSLGDDWPLLVERIGRAWDVVAEDGSIPEGFDP